VAALHVIAAIVGVLLIAVVLWETFETLVLPRRVDRRLRLTRIYFRSFWHAWSAVGRGSSGPRREKYLSVFAPLSLLFLFGLWAIGVILGFALLQWGLQLAITGHRAGAFGTDVYFSATTFLTLGLGDVTPLTSPGRAITAVEAGLGFAFLALAISYLPVMYQAFSRREVRISMLDQWAGSPPSAMEIFRRASQFGDLASVNGLLADWELWAAELLESHLSYPILAWFRSQHDNQSWLAALTTILDASALALSGVDGVSPWQARRTFAMARHAVVDLAQVLADRYEPTEHMRPDDRSSLRDGLEAAGVGLHPRMEERLAPYRRMYEPYAHALSHRLQMPLPPFAAGLGGPDDWETSGWTIPG
jgi:hypothetical protein